MVGKFFYPSSLLSLLAVILLHGGVGYGYYWWYTHNRANPQVITATQGLEVYEFSLAGVEESEEITNRHDEEVVFREGPDEPPVEDEEIVDNSEEEVIEDESIEEDPTEEESSIEDIEEDTEEEFEERPEEIIIPEEEILTTKAENEIVPEVLKPDPEPDPEPEPESEPPPSPKPKPQPKPNEKVEASSKPPRVDQQQSKQVEKRVLDISEVSIINAPPPNYPHNAVRRRQTGVVRIMMEVNEKGLVTSANIVKSSGHTSLDKEALRVAKQIRLNPYTINGVAHAITVVRNYEFSL